MISDADLYRLAIFLGSCSMMMVVLYHFLEVNAQDDESDTQVAPGNSSKVSGNGESIAAGAPPVPVGGSSSAIGGGKSR
ncbi:Oligosaccaryltransferase [Aspergillus sclerotialis]|uniref:Dolichyl-diphosphooligosaccharide--protein glycosyltransferase subunit 4 n=1 Tax=Aspergillus sclerotialis TaxID=2070753 RepID=A0A3A2ZMY4_9EURO|nr:Oligosaccaryltransferase [Aspergillus sclerotialis]